MEYLNRAVLKEAEALVPTQRARLQRIIELVQAHGLERVREPHVKHLEGRLWEIRISGRGGIARAAYVTAIRETRGDRAGVREENAEDAAP